VQPDFEAHVQRWRDELLRDVEAAQKRSGNADQHPDVRLRGQVQHHDNMPKNSAEVAMVGLEDKHQTAGPIPMTAIGPRSRRRRR